MATTTLRTSTGYRSGLYEWLTTTDHKKIGILYLANSILMFLLGGVFALVVRLELAQPGLQFLTDAQYNQAFTIHAFSFWLLPLAAIVMLCGFATGGGAAAAGWTEYSPLAQAKYEGIGTDLWIVALLLIGTSSILGAINFIVTIFKMRAPGMTLLRMPVMVWTVLVTSILVLMATPVLTSALIMLFIDRNLGGHFFDPATGGNAILWQNTFWFYSHPAVYIMILPAMGIISEVLPVFSRKPLFGYKAFIFATAGIGALGFSVWAHHMFTTHL